jgi:hypothetical protein
MKSCSLYKKLAINIGHLVAMAGHWKSLQKLSVTMSPQADGAAVSHLLREAHQLATLYIKHSLDAIPLPVLDQENRNYRSELAFHPSPNTPRSISALQSLHTTHCDSTLFGSIATPNLREIVVRGKSADVGSAWRLLRTTQGELRSVDAEGCNTLRFAPLPAPPLPPTSNFRNLRNIRFYDCSTLTSACIAILVERCLHLQTATVQKCTAVHVSAFQSLCSLRHLRSLEFRDNQPMQTLEYDDMILQSLSTLLRHNEELRTCHHPRVGPTVKWTLLREFPQRLQCLVSPPSSTMGQLLQQQPTPSKNPSVLLWEDCFTSYIYNSRGELVNTSHLPRPWNIMRADFEKMKPK